MTERSHEEGSSWEWFVLFILVCLFCQMTCALLVKYVILLKKFNTICKQLIFKTSTLIITQETFFTFQISQILLFLKLDLVWSNFVHFVLCTLASPEVFLYFISVYWCIVALQYCISCRYIQLSSIVNQLYVYIYPCF